MTETLIADAERIERRLVEQREQLAQLRTDVELFGSANLLVYVAAMEAECGSMLARVRFWLEHRPAA